MISTKRAELELKPRRWLRVGGGLLVLGIALVGIDSSDIGMVVTLIALLLVIYGIHTFGRLGPDDT